MCLLYSVRLVGWYTSGIWKKPLLWSLYLAMIFIVVGFLLFTLSVYAGISKYLAIHALAYGGVGVMTMSMMARVSLGHTGRNINEPPKMVKYMLALLLAGAIFRVFLPIILPGNYLVWIISSQLIWLSAFIMFVMSFAPILIKPRLDGQFG